MSILNYDETLEEIERLRTEDWGRAIEIQELADLFPDLQLFRDCHGRLQYCATSVSADADGLEIDICREHLEPRLEVRPFMYMDVHDSESVGAIRWIRIYSDPPCINVASENPRGFGVIPWDGWRENLEDLGLSRFVIREVGEYLQGHPPINYLGEDRVETQPQQADRGVDRGAADQDHLA